MSKASCNKVVPHAAHAYSASTRKLWHSAAPKVTLRRAFLFALAMAEPAAGDGDPAIGGAFGDGVAVSALGDCGGTNAAFGENKAPGMFSAKRTGSRRERTAALGSSSGALLALPMSGTCFARSSPTVGSLGDSGGESQSETLGDFGDLSSLGISQGPSEPRSVAFATGLPANVTTGREMPPRTASWGKATDLDLACALPQTPILLPSARAPVRARSQGTQAL